MGVHHRGVVGLPDKEVSMAALPEGTEIFTVTEIADFLKVNRRTVLNMLRSNELKGFRVRSEWRVTREALLTFIEQRDQPQTGDPGGSSET